MKTIIIGIDQATGMKVIENIFVNNNSAIENLVNYFLQDKGMQLFTIEKREEIKKNIVCVNNRSALIEINGIDYIATRRAGNNNPLPNSDERTLLADEKSAKFYIKKNKIMKTEEFNNSLRTNTLGEFKDSDNNETVLYIEFNEEKQCINVGTLSNCGLITDFSVDYDDDFSLDQNLENVLEEVYNNGYSVLD